MESREGVNQLAGVLQGRCRAVSEKASVVDVGVIQGDMSLKTNKFPLAIPKSDYMVCRSVTWGSVDDVWYHTEEVSGHRHDMLVGESVRGLSAGDRVLVVWIDDCDPCVVDLLLPASGNI